MVRLTGGYARCVRVSLRNLGPGSFYSLSTARTLERLNSPAPSQQSSATNKTTGADPGRIQQRHAFLPKSNLPMECLITAKRECEYRAQNQYGRLLRPRRHQRDSARPQARIRRPIWQGYAAAAPTSRGLSSVTDVGGTPQALRPGFFATSGRATPPSHRHRES